MRRIFICLLCISLLVGNMVITSNAQQYVMEDVEHISSELLEYLGVINGEEDYTKNVTRKEFAQTLAKILLIEQGSYTQNYYYKDVETTSVINDLTSLGYFEGNGEMFFPDDTICLYDSYIVLLRVLGYQPYLKAVNFDYARILQTAKKAGVIDSIQENGDVNFATMVELLGNMLLAKQFETVELSGGEVLFSEGECLLGELYDIYYAEGVVIANSTTSLYENVTKTSDGEVNISGVLYEFEPDIFENVLGKEVEFCYYKSSKTKMPKIVCFADISEDEIELVNEDVISYSSDILRYYENDKNKYLKLDNPVVIYNGVATFEMSNSEIQDAIKATRTKIRVNKDEKGIYKYLFVDTYTNGRIRYIDFETKTLYLNLPSGTKTLKLEDCVNGKRCSIMRFSDKKAVDFSQLKNGDFVSVCYDVSETNIRIVICDKSISGVVADVYDDEISIDGTLCSLDKDYISEESIVPGETGTFYYDAFGNIAFKTAERRYDAKIGYIYDIDLKSQFADEVLLKLYEENGTCKVYSLAKKPVLDGNKEDVKTVYEKLISYDVIGKHLIGFKVDKDGQINWIDTAYDTSDGDNSLHMIRDLENLNFEIVGSMGNYQFYKWREAATLAQAEACFPVSTDATAIVVPSDDASNREYAFGTAAATSRFATDGKYNVELYNFGSDSPFVEVVLHRIQDGERYIDYGEECYMVSRVASSLSDIEETATTEIDLLYCTDYAESSSNSKKTVQFAPKVTFEYGNLETKEIDGTKVADMLGEGDVVLVRERADGAGCFVRLLFDYSEQQPFWGDSYESATYSEFVGQTVDSRYIYGCVESLYIPSFATDDHYVFSVADNEDIETFRDMCAVQGNYYRYPIYDSNRMKDNAYVGYMNEIDAYQNSNKTTYSKVFVKMVDGVSVDSIFFFK